MRTDVTAVTGKQRTGSSPAGHRRQRVRQILGELDADLAAKARNNESVRQMVQQAGRELANAAQRKAVTRVPGGWFWEAGESIEPVADRQIWIQQSKMYPDAHYVGMIVTELDKDETGQNPESRGRLWVVARINGCDPAALALALQIAAEPVGHYSETADRINQEWMDNGRNGKCPCEERYMSCDDEEDREYLDSILWPVCGCGDAGMAMAYDGPRGVEFIPYVRPTLGAKKSGLPAGNSTAKLGGNVSAEAGEGRAAVGRDNSTVSGLPQSVDVAGRRLRVVLADSLPGDVDAHVSLYRNVVKIQRSLSPERQRRSLREALAKAEERIAATKPAADPVRQPAASSGPIPW